MYYNKKEEAIKALKECDEFYLLVSKNNKRKGFWNTKDYAKLYGVLSIASKWFKDRVLDSFSKTDDSH